MADQRIPQIVRAYPSSPNTSTEAPHSRFQVEKGEVPLLIHAMGGGTKNTELALKEISTQIFSPYSAFFFNPFIMGFRAF